MVHDNHLHRTMQTEYDLAERPMQSTLRDEDGNVLYRATLTYDAQDRLQTFHERTGDTYHKTAFTYDKDSRVTQMDYDTDRGKVEYTYDTLGRVSSRKVTNGETAYGRPTPSSRVRHPTAATPPRRWSHPSGRARATAP